MNGYGNGNSFAGAVGSWLTFFAVLLVVMFALGGVVSENSYWGNPSKQQALSARLELENRDLANELVFRERQRELDFEHYQESLVRQQTWTDRWNLLGLALVALGVAAASAIAVLRLVLLPIMRERRLQAEARRKQAEAERDRWIQEREMFQAIHASAPRRDGHRDPFDPPPSRVANPVSDTGWDPIDTPADEWLEPAA